ncbi:hypothetical protein Y88_1074 [Novosphingobium nitrogenifigens DSM 19370]|uniref:Uncharacterized protein n=1 Tax=Novosphingobium nitrogenifigens DSM 19370 TaxID=983920 RepID=F1Z8L2_9SPHN|nr:hypothetical protein Y88_1074 [Novosphingobium nitrogenifigens DSM 19370]
MQVTDLAIVFCRYRRLRLRSSGKRGGRRWRLVSVQHFSPFDGTDSHKEKLLP